MKAEKDPLNGAMMDVTKVHFSLFFLPSFLKGTLSSFATLKSRTWFYCLWCNKYVTEYIHYHFFSFYNLNNDKWRDATVTKSAL